VQIERIGDKIISGTMKLKETKIILLILIVINIFFFYKTFFLGLLPFPGDLLISEYNPWKTYSYFGYNPGSYPNKAQYFDVLRQLYPWKILGIDQFRSGNIPLWNPYNFSGAPLLANFQSALFYPLNVVYSFLPWVFAWSILVIIQPFLALFFTFFYARKIGLSRLGSVFSAVSFAFSSFMTVWLEYNTIGHVILWLPLILLSIENLLLQKEIKWILLFVFSLVSSLFAGHIQIFFYLLLFLTAYFLFRNFSLHKKIINRNFLFFFLLIFLSLGIGAIQLIPGFELINESARSPHSYDFMIKKILIQPWQLIMFFVPDFFGNPATRNYYLPDTYIGKVTSVGIVSVFFILISIFFKKDNIKRFYLGTCLLILLLVTRNPLTAALYKMEIPVFSANAPTLGVFLFCFSASILAGFGLDLYKKESLGLKKHFYLISPFFLLFLFSYFAIFFLNKINLIDSTSFKVSLHNLSYSTIILFFFSFFILWGATKKKLKYIVLICLLILNMFDLLRLFEKFNPFSPKELVFPKAPVLEFLQKEGGINRFWGYGYGAIEANFASYYKLFSPDGYDPLYPKLYGEFIGSSKNGKIQKVFTAENRSDAKVAPSSGEDDFLSNYYRFKVLDLLGVRYILDRIENRSSKIIFDKERFRLIYQKDGWRIFENLKAAPRLFLSSSYKTFETDQEFEKLFFASDFDPAKTILLEKDFNAINKFGISEKEIGDNLKIVSYKPNEIVFETSVKGNKILFLSDTYYPGWKALVDGRETKIYKANYAFRAIVIPAGIHTGKFIYDPESFKLGYRVTLLSAAALLIFIFLLSNYAKQVYNRLQNE